MEHIRIIQEIVDEYKEAMPTGVVTDLMAECQKAYDAMPKLWMISYVEVAVSTGGGHLEALSKVLIAEEVDNGDAHVRWRHVFNSCEIPPVDKRPYLAVGVPTLQWGGKDDCVRVITKVEPYRKRAGEERQ